MVSILPFILIVISLVVVIYILVRKYPQLILLDVENLKEVKEKKKKFELWRNRVIKKVEEDKKSKLIKLAPVLDKLKNRQGYLKKYLINLQNKVNLQKKSKENSGKIVKLKDEDLKMLINEGKTALANKDYNLAEGKFISVLKIDFKNKDACKGLGEVYLSLKQYKEAEEILNFIFKVDPRNEEVILLLAEVAEQKGNILKAIEYYEQAVLLNENISSRFFKLFELFSKIEQYETALEAIKQAFELEPQNPKYLDSLIETSIMLGNKKIAESGFRALRMVNPENQKLDIFREKITKMK